MIHFTQNQGHPLQVNGTITGLPPNTPEFQIHIHEFGDFTLGCQSLGEIYNPTHANNTNKIIGNLARVKNSSGVTSFHFNDTNASLFGEIGIIGRAVAVHQASGHSGFMPNMLLCGLIGYRNTSWLE